MLKTEALAIASFIQQSEYPNASKHVETRGPTTCPVSFTSYYVLCKSRLSLVALNEHPDPRPLSGTDRLSERVLTKTEGKKYRQTVPLRIQEAAVSWETPLLAPGSDNLMIYANGCLSTKAMVLPAPTTREDH